MSRISLQLDLEMSCSTWFLATTTLNIVFGVTNSICLAQFLIVNLTLLVIPCKEVFWALYIYNVAVTSTY